MLPFQTNFVAPDGTSLPSFNSRFIATAGAVSIYGNLAVGDTGGAVTLCALYDPLQSADQVVEGVVGAVGGISYTGLCVRCGLAGTGNGYWWLGTAGVAEFGTLTGGAFAVLGTTSPFAGGDALKIIAQGTSLQCYINGVLDTSFTDGTYPTGYAGICGFRDDHISGMQTLKVNNLNPFAGNWAFFPR